MTKTATTTPADLIEYAALTARQLRAGILELSDTVLANASSFMVSKRDGERQREVWNGSRISSLAARPPMPPRLANPCALAELIFSDDVPLVASSRDAEVFFNQLLAPEYLRPFLGKAPLRVKDFLSVVDGE